MTDVAATRARRALTGGGATSALALLARATPVISLLRQFGFGLRLGATT